MSPVYPRREEASSGRRRPSFRGRCLVNAAEDGYNGSVTSPTIVWFRLDLRLEDNPALAEAVARGLAIPVFIWAPEEEGTAAPGAASRWWLNRSLAALDESLRRRGSRLILRRGPAGSALRELARETGSKAVFWSRRVEPSLAARDARVQDALRAEGLEVKTFNSSLLFEPGDVKTLTGNPYQVFTPFWRACLERPEPEAPLPAPASLGDARALPRGETLDAFRLLPKVEWTAGLGAAWIPGEAGARERLDAFVELAAGGYHESRDLMAEDGVSRLSPHLHFGEISPRAVWAAVSRRAAGAPCRGPEAYLRELGWREFAHHLLARFPRTVDRPLRPEFESFPWRSDVDGFERWTRGRTGYPAVDAGMRQLWRSGWMHNRARMVAASFLVKDLLVDWRQGAAWFWDTLVDADQANNTLGWQWVAGCGADAAPFFRIFNPILQGKKFDPEGIYVKRWVPELAELPPKLIHEPWKADAAHLGAAGGYPLPIIDHGRARVRALAALSLA
ncbi:MAG: deoxyribodipyrimidine photo-lyase, partial [Elusimicrobia bacterium]|nr:deoxyribodipyrimidine photo-lyase [Elusimicrobiota bacterium]